MNDKPKKLGEAELEIMQAVWDSDAPITSNHILKELQGKRKWQLSTLMTSLSRMCDKGFLHCDRSTGTNLYTALIAEDVYKVGEGKSFLERLYDSSIRNMVAALYDSRAIRQNDLDELRDFLNTLEKHAEAKEDEEEKP